MSVELREFEQDENKEDEETSINSLCFSDFKT